MESGFFFDQNIGFEAAPPPGESSNRKPDGYGTNPHKGLSYHGLEAFRNFEFKRSQAGLDQATALAAYPYQELDDAFKVETELNVADVLTNPIALHENAESSLVNAIALSTAILTISLASSVIRKAPNLLSFVLTFIHDLILRKIAFRDI